MAYKGNGATDQNTALFYNTIQTTLSFENTTFGQNALVS